MFPMPPDPYPRPVDLPPPREPRAALAGDGSLGGEAALRPPTLVAGEEVAESPTTAGATTGDAAAATLAAAAAESEPAPAPAAAASSSGGGELPRPARWYGRAGGTIPAAIAALEWLEPWPL